MDEQTIKKICNNMDNAKQNLLIAELAAKEDLWLTKELMNLSTRIEDIKVTFLDKIYMKQLKRKDKTNG